MTDITTADGTGNEVAPGVEAPALTPEQIATEAAKAAAAKPVVIPTGEAPNPADALHDGGEDDGDQFVYDKTGDVRLDVALDFVGKLGIGGDHPAMVAAATGDFSLMEATLATAGAKAAGWESMVALAKAAYGEKQTAAQTAAAASTAAVHAVAGGAENWNTVLKFAAENGTPEEKKQLNAMFDAGPLSARAAAMMLVEQYNKAGGTTVNPANPAANAAGGTPAVNGKLNPREYAAEVRKLESKYGNQLTNSSEYAALRQRLVAN